MKNIIITAIAFIFCYGSVMAQQTIQQQQVPTAVIEQLATTAKNSTNAEWSMKDGIYRAQFGPEGKKQLIEFDSTGNITATGIQILQADLLPSIGHTVKENYENRRIKTTYKLDRDGIITYMVTLKGQPFIRLFYSEDGKQITNDESNW